MTNEGRTGELKAIEVRILLTDPELLEGYQDIDTEFIEDDIRNNPKGWLLAGDSLNPNASLVVRKHICDKPKTERQAFFDGFSIYESGLPMPNDSQQAEGWKAAKSVEEFISNRIEDAADSFIKRRDAMIEC